MPRSTAPLRVRLQARARNLKLEDVRNDFWLLEAPTSEQISVHFETLDTGAVIASYELPAWKEPLPHTGHFFRNIAANVYGRLHRVPRRSMQYGARGVEQDV